MRSQIPATRPPAVVFPDNPAALALCRELGSHGIRVFVLSSDDRGPAAWSRFATPVASPDLYVDADAFAGFLIEAGRWDGGAVLFPTEDAALLVVERYRARLEGLFRLPYAAAAAAALLDKRRLHAAAVSAGLAVPRTETVTSDAEAARFAGTGWIVKPPCRYRLEEGGQIRTLRSSLGPSKAVAGNVCAAVAAVVNAGFTALVQEAVAGPVEDLCSVGLCLGPDGSILASFTARKRLEYREPFGDGLVVESISDPGLEEPARRLLQAAGYWGVCDVEFKRDARDGQFKLLDANPRPWLWMTLGTLAGAHLGHAAYSIAIGEPWNGAGQRGRAGRRWICPRGAAGFLRNQYRPGRHGIRLPLALGAGLARQSLATWRAFRDPVCLRGGWRMAGRFLGGQKSGARPAASGPPVWSPRLEAGATKGNRR